MGLKITLLGQFKLQAKDLPIELPSRPAQSLLAYLALNAGVTQRREKLASLLWPEASETNARSYLRQALWRIRKALERASIPGENYLETSDISITFKAQADYWVDAALLLEIGEAPTIEDLTEAVSLYQGELLPGFYDEWIVLERDRLQAVFHQMMNLLLEHLIQAEQWDKTLKWGEQWIRLGFAPEPAFRYIMLAHAGLGDQGMVNSTYQRCVESLSRELDLEPSPETQQLYEQIHHGEFGVIRPTHTHNVPPAVRRPAFLVEDQSQPTEKPIFVARERELSQIETQLDMAMNAQGRVVFITGEAGSGKTALIHEFTRRAQEAHEDLIVASGKCNAYTGIGDPYLPFRQVLELLTGDVEARWAAGAISGEHARLLWYTFPITAQALVESGADLIDTFVPGAALVERAAVYTTSREGWLTRLEEIVDRKTKASMIPNPRQSDLFEQYSRVLGTVARQAPLILLVDDLQWVDSGSIGLLFHLGRNLMGSRILIVGAYRPEEVALSRDGDRHPLDPVVSEFQRQFGDITIDLGQAENREFVESILDSEPNRLGPSFRQMLFQQTRGHPLFTIELMRGMQERGDVVNDQEDQWIESATLDWETLPARVEAVIAERTKRLPQALRAALRVASVEGEEFSAEVVARVLGSDEREMVQRLSSELDRRHRLIRAQAIERLGSQRLSRYRFRHYLCQKYLYDNLDPVERSYLHEDVGNALEALYADQEQGTAAIAPQLARHFQEAGITEKAIHYLHQAGEKALQLSAYQEGITHLKRALALLKTLPESPERDEIELALQLSFGKAVTGIPGPEWKNAYTRARELCLQMGDMSQLCRILGELSISHYVKAEYHMARELEGEALSMAQQAGDLLMVAISHWYLGFVSFGLGEFTTALDHLEQMISFYDPQQHHQPIVVLRGSDAGTSALSYAACCLWCLGYPDQALERSQEALALAREHDHAFSLVDVLGFAGCLFNSLRRDGPALKDHAEQMLELSKEKSFQGWLGTATIYWGNSLSMLGQVKEGVAQIKQGMAINQSIGTRCYLSGYYSFLAEGQAKASPLEEALTSLEEGFAVIEETDERYYEAELNRLRGELMLKQVDKTAAEASLHNAIEVARRQKAKSWELRAATDLARLWESQGKADEAHALLAPIYDWFTEGFDTQDLIAAKKLLEDLT